MFDFTELILSILQILVIPLIISYIKLQSDVKVLTISKLDKSHYHEDIDAKFEKIYNELKEIRKDLFLKA